MRPNALALFPAEPAPRYGRGYSDVISLLLIVGIFVIGIALGNFVWIYDGHTSYRKEMRLAVAIRHMPTTAIPARDRPTIAAMRAGKRLTNFQFDRLRTDVRPYLQARQRRLLQQRMKSVARRGAHAR